MRRLVFLACGLFGIYAMGAGCSDGNPGATTATSTTTSTTSSSSTSTSTSATTSTGTGAGGSGGTGGSAPEGCISPDGKQTPDGVCTLGELCSCPDCAPTAYCNYDQCTPDSVCDVMDSCTCKDCDTNYKCVDPGDHNCVDDGYCDSFDEGCGCSDCYSKQECIDNAAACYGGVPDGICDPAAEDCLCSDCLGDVACLTCADDVVCSDIEPCFCTDCLENLFCTSPGNCYDDGICAALYEGCACDDCSGRPECGGGTGAGGGGGGGGAGGSGGGGGAGGGPPDPCANGTIDGTETDVDCGGSCGPCPVGGICVLGSDCTTHLCQANVCSGCLTNAECASNNCSNGACIGVCGSPDVSVPIPTCPAQAAGAGPNCSAANINCCATKLVTCGTYSRSYDNVTYVDPSNKATISDFRMAEFEVTLGRFRLFVNQGYGVQTNPPAAGAGANPQVPSSGWDPTWNQYLPVDTTALKAGIKCPGSFTWTSSVGANEKLPINCVTWYEAMAFCIRDGGFLPTEAQWNYAAAGGSLQRQFPWGGPMVDNTYAVYQCLEDGNPLCALTDIAPVGAKTPQGDGFFGTHDLAGNMGEWTFDYYQATYPLPCNDCTQTVVGTERVIRGGNYTGAAGLLETSDRQKRDPTLRSSNTGIRCAFAP